MFIKSMAKTTTKKRAIGYIRVSTKEQADTGVSLDNQEYKIKAYSEVKDLDLIEIIREEGKSGKDLKREGVNKIIRMIENKEIDALVVYKLDRLTRKTKDLLYLVEDVFNKNNVAFYSLNENIDTTTAQGKFFLTIMGAMAQMERDLISERTSDALQTLKTRERRRLGCPDKVALGFKLGRRNKTTLDDYKQIPKEIKIVKKMFKMRKQKKSFAKIGQAFNFNKSSVYYILNNPIYRTFNIVKV